MGAQTLVCDSCTEAVMRETEELGIDATRLEAGNYARFLGADIADHVCDYREKGLLCGCACRLLAGPRKVNREGTS